MNFGREENLPAKPMGSEPGSRRVLINFCSEPCDGKPTRNLPENLPDVSSGKSLPDV